MQGVCREWRGGRTAGSVSQPSMVLTCTHTTHTRTHAPRGSGPLSNHNPTARIARNRMIDPVTTHAPAGTPGPPRSSAWAAPSICVASCSACRCDLSRCWGVGRWAALGERCEAAARRRRTNRGEAREEGPVTDRIEITDALEGSIDRIIQMPSTMPRQRQAAEEGRSMWKWRTIQNPLTRASINPINRRGNLRRSSPTADFTFTLGFGYGPVCARRVQGRFSRFWKDRSNPTSKLSRSGFNQIATNQSIWMVGLVGSDPIDRP